MWSQNAHLLMRYIAMSIYPVAELGARRIWQKFRNIYIYCAFIHFATLSIFLFTQKFLAF